MRLCNIEEMMMIEDVRIYDVRRHSILGGLMKLKNLLPHNNNYISLLSNTSFSR